MVRSLFLSFLALCSFVGADAANIASISNGQYDDPSTWNCTCVPTDTDVVIVRHKVIVSVASEAMRVVIRSNARLTSFAPLEILGALKIVNGGEMKNFDLLTIKGFYVLNGVHSGTGTTDLRGERISGTGEMSNTGSFEISGGKVVIRPLYWNLDITCPWFD